MLIYYTISAALRAYDGMEALDKAVDPQLRLILMDVMMPRLDGLSAVLRIRVRVRAAGS